MSSTSIANRASDFRQAFDKTYALPRASGNDTTWEDFLAIRIAGDDYAIRLREIAGLVKGRRVIACPSSVPEFQGIAGVRGLLVSVYSLPALLGYNIAAGHVSWLFLCAAEPSLGFAFPEFAGFVRALPGQIHSASDHDAPSRHSARTSQVLRLGDEVRTIVSIARLLARCFGDSKQTRGAESLEINRDSKGR